MFRESEVNNEIVSYCLEDSALVATGTVTDEDTNATAHSIAFGL